MRASAVGFCSTISRIGSILAPVIVEISVQRLNLPWIPYLAFGIASVLGGCSVVKLPETMNSELPDTVEEALEIRQ